MQINYVRIFTASNTDELQININFFAETHRIKQVSFTPFIPIGSNHVVYFATVLYEI